MGREDSPPPRTSRIAGVSDEGRYRHRQRGRTRLAPLTGRGPHQRTNPGSRSRRRSSVPASSRSPPILGQILTAGQDRTRPRASIAAGIGREPGLGRQPALRLRLRAVALGYQAILNGDNPDRGGGWPESMSMATRAAPAPGREDGRRRAVDTMIKDGLWDAFNGYHMGTTAERRQSGRSPGRSRTSSPSNRRTRPRRR